MLPSKRGLAMVSLVSLQGYEPKLQEYLLRKRYPAILEVSGCYGVGGAGSDLVCVQALLTGLAVMIPEDPWQFMLDKIAELVEAGDLQDIQW